MSITITAMGIPHVANSDWATINTYLTRTDSSDWRYLRPSLLRAICNRQRRFGIPISQGEESALLDLYNSETPPVNFLAAWLKVRNDLG